MPEIIRNTSPLQYLHQLGALHLLPQLVSPIIIPPAVKQELEVGRALGLALPDVESLSWIVTRMPSSAPALPLVTDLGAVFLDLANEDARIQSDFTMSAQELVQPFSG